MASNGKNAVSKAQADAHRRLLSQLIRQDDNRRCADCQTRGPTWASVNLGVFVCLNCSGVHRSLGTHTSKVRSTTLDTWLPEQVAFVQRMGNRRANLFWEARLPKEFRRPSEGDMSGLSIFIGDKYREGLYALRTWDKPPTIETYLVHPFMKEVDGGEEAPPEAAADESAPRRGGQTSTESPAARSSGPEPIISGGRAEGLPRASSARRVGPLAPPAKPPTPPPKPATPPPELFDLLSLHEPSTPAPAAPSPPPTTTTHLDAFASPTPTPAQGTLNPKAGVDDDWAAFVNGSVEPPAVQSAAPADEWDAFQGGETAPTSSGSDPFGASGDPFAESNSTQAAFPTASARFASAPSSPSKTEPVKQHRAQKSAEEIMRMFDSPSTGSGGLQDNLFTSHGSAAPSQVNTSSQENFFALPGSNGMPGQPGMPAQPGSQENFFALPGSAGMSGQPGIPAQPGLSMPPMPWMGGAMPPFPMPGGVPSHTDLTFPQQMFQMPPGTMPQMPAGFPGGDAWPPLPSTAPNPGMNHLGGPHGTL